MKDPDHGDQTPRSDDDVRRNMATARRKFIKGCLAFGAGVLVYSTPAVRAYAGSQYMSPPGPVFDVTLPAHYSLNAVPIVLRFAITGHQPIDVSFNVAGTVSLVTSGSPNVATVLITGALQSVSNNPLQPAGLNCGQLSANLAANTVVGSLNLLTGVYTPLPEIEVQLSSIACGAGPGSVGQSGGVPVQNSEGDKCTIRDNDLSMFAAISGSPTIITGEFRSNLVPILAAPSR